MQQGGSSQLGLSSTEALVPETASHKQRHGEQTDPEATHNTQIPTYAACVRCNYAYGLSWERRGDEVKASVRASTQ